MNSFTLRLFKSFAFLLLIFAATVAPIAAQDLDNVTINGRVVDSNGAAVAGATVTATVIATGLSRTVVSDDDGRYRLIKLEPGVYSIKATMNGFAVQEKTNLTTIAGQTVQIDFNLSPAGVSAEQIITLDGENEPVVDTSRTVVGGTITSREIEEIPITTRNPLDLVLTLGGTSEEALSTRDLAEDRNTTSATAPAEQGNFSLSGGVSYSNNITIDGLDNNDDRAATFRFQPSLEMVDEVQVITNQFSGEYGRASGGRINLRIRSGTNRFRGRAFMFFRDDNMNANTWYNNSRRLPRLPFTEYNPGIVYSGPVVLPKIYNGRNKTFFSVSYEYLNLQDTTLIDTYLPDVSNPRYPLPQGNSTCPVAVCTDVNSSPAVALTRYTNSYSTPNANHIVITKFDHIINDANNFTAGFQFGRRKNRRTSAASVTRLDDALQAKTINSDAFNFTDNHSFNGNFFNQFRFQYSIYEPSFQTDTPDDPVVLIGYRNPETGGNQTLIVGNSTASGGNSETFPQNRRETRFQFVDTVTYTKGNNTLKLGFDIQSIRSKAKELGDATGTFNFANMGTFQANQLSRFRLNFGTGSDVKNRYWSFFFNDEMKLGGNVTLNFGLRYERESSVSDNDNFGPRFGLAWSPDKKSKSVIRVGGGVFYNRTLLRTIADFIQNVNGILPFDTNSIGTGATDVRRVAVLAALSNRFPESFTSDADLRNLVVQACASITTTLTCNSNTGFIVNSGSTGNPLRSVDPDLKIPESYQFNVGFERELFKGWVFEANYTWNRTIRLWRDRNINTPVLPTGFNDWASFLEANPYQFVNANGTIRTYRFYRGNAVSTAPTTTQTGTTSCPTAATTDCWVNLNSTSTSTTSPSTAVTGTSTNSIGGAIGIALAAIARFRPDPNFEEKSRIGSNGRAFYHGLVLELRSRYRKWGNGFGGNFRFNYTLSSTKDDGLNNTANAQVNGAFDEEYTRTITDRRHRIAFSGSFDTPWWLGKVRFSPLLRAGSSAPFSIGIGGSDRNLDDLGTDRPNFSGDLSNVVWSNPGVFNQELFNQFSLPTIGSRGGNLPRNAGKGPGFYTFDLNLSREFKFGERYVIRPTVEFGNILNAAVFNFGAAFIDYTGTNFLVPSRTFRQRQIRLGMRFDF